MRRLPVAGLALTVWLGMTGATRAPAATPLPRLAPESVSEELRARPALSPEQRQFRTSLERKLSPAQSARLQPTIAAVRAVLSGKTPGDAEALAAAGARTAFPGASAMDAEALAYVVLSEAASGADDDLKATAAQLQAETASKQRLREQLAATDSATAASDTVKQQGSLNAQLESANDLSEMQARQLQLALDQRIRLLAALGNMQKSLEDAQQALLQNLKS